MMVSHKWTATCIAMAILIVLAMLFCLISDETEEPPFYLKLASDDRTERIQLWEQENGDYYGFLPAYTNLENLSIQLTTANTVILGDVVLEDGMHCDEFPIETQLELVTKQWLKNRRSTVTFMQSENIPAMYIDTQSGTMDYIHEKKGNAESGWMRLYTETGMKDFEGELQSIHGRGNATWTKAEKKPYSVELLFEENLLGMGTATKWILLANALDMSNMRNKLAYDFAALMGMEFSPETRWVDLYLNGEYVGLYLLAERNEVHKERVNISLKESFLVSLELDTRLASQNYPHVITNAKQAVRIHSPKNPETETLERILAQWQTAENAILSEDGIDPITGMSWLDLIDLDSWAQKVLMEEVFGNIDGCFMSQYFYYDPNASRKIFAGPVWDFDNVLGLSETWQLSSPNVLITNRLQVRPGYDSPWFYALWEKEEFQQKVICLFENDFLPALEDLTYQEIPNMANRIESACLMNKIRWESENIDLRDEAQEISSYLQKRIDFLSDIWLDGQIYHIIKADQSFGSYYAYYAVYSGEKPLKLPEFEDTQWESFAGWFYEGTNEPFDPDRPITEDMSVYCKWENKPDKIKNQLLQLMPLAVIAMAGCWLLLAELKRDINCLRKTSNQYANSIDGRKR